ncbi:hypothetical protein DSM112329_00216 [Paraconexibacter sp. AEG42_29]|uniref:DUF403 domain-containing protein n=1 Tax=Paraconexibacter sp. AEG42_29 TaxID=2997339 RepID=A0AAU7AP74_9ACTN
MLTPSASYRAPPERYDEMLGGDGRPRAHWEHLSGAINALGVDELLRRRAEAERVMEQDGAVYNAYGASARPGQPWRLDVLPAVLSSREWQGIESAVAERAELLGLVLEDLYGPRDLLRRGLLPPEVVFGHDGFLLACDGIRLPGERQLFCVGTDLGRDGSGRWVVIADRAQSPSGFGYALQNRTVVSRVLPSLVRDAGVHRLAPFFRTLRGALRDIAPPGVEDPRVVVLTPGPWNETAFEHAVLSSTLGYPLVEGSDLIAKGDGLWMRSLGALEPVHVVLRRVDGGWCDPLELRRDSQLGVPGLVEATRRGTVSVVNTLGSSILENPALMRFLPAIGRHLLGREPELPCVESWWCGLPAERAHVLERLDQLVLRPITAAAGSKSLFGAQLSQLELEDLRRRIEHRPSAWVAQDPVTLSSVPTLTDAGLLPRRCVLRTFAVAAAGSYAVMPGGLTRVAPDANGGGRISNQEGALSKDTWVLTSEPEREALSFSGPALASLDPMGGLSARAAENLWWLGRYAERAEAVTRLLRVMHDQRSELLGSGGDAGKRALATLGTALGAVTGAASAVPPDTGVLQRTLLVDDHLPGSVAHAVRAMLDAAYGVRDQLSSDTWLVVGSLDRQLLRLRTGGNGGGALSLSDAEARETLQRLMQGLLALGGLGEESMVRDLGWRFLDGGRRLERCLQVIALLRATLARTDGAAADPLVLEAVVASTESIIIYRRRYRAHAQVPDALELLLLDPGNPRSLAFGLDRLTRDLGALPARSDGRLRKDQQLVLRATTALALADHVALAVPDEDGERSGLAALLDELHDLLSRAADALEREQFVHRLPQQNLEGS